MKSIICLMLLVFCSISRAATPIDGLYSNIFGGYVYLPGNVNHSYGSGTINAAAYQGGYEAGGSIGYKSNPMRYEGEVTYLKASIKNFAFNSTQITPTRGFDQAAALMVPDP